MILESSNWNLADAHVQVINSETTVPFLKWWKHYEFCTVGISYKCQLYDVIKSTESYCARSFVFINLLVLK